jgi:hypothetical protein
MQRVIREEEAPRPSLRLSTLGERLPVVARDRHCDPKQLRQLLRGELDWIVMKSLEKERGRRYESASSFAADVQRYLSNQPVEAHPPSLRYRLRKFVRRNKGPVFAAAVVLLVLLLGLAGTSLGLLQARRQAELAWQAEQEALAAKEHALDQRQVAAANAALARKGEAQAQQLSGELEHNLYTARLHLAQQSWEAANAGRASTCSGSTSPSPGRRTCAARSGITSGASSTPRTKRRCRTEPPSSVSPGRPTAPCWQRERLRARSSSGKQPAAGSWPR